jgi:hypothetical protein
MLTTSVKMNRQSIASFILVSLTSILLLSSCKKDIDRDNHQSSKYSSEVLDKWMAMQVRLIKNTTGVANHAFTRHFAYSGIAALESLAPGMPAHSRWSEVWNGLAGLPVPDPSVKYYFPANVNAAMAAVNRSFFPNASNADKMAIDSLESALKAAFPSTVSPEVINKSVAFGQSVAAAVFTWCETDGYKNGSGPYTPPVGDGLWVATPPAFANAATPYWGNNRTIVAGSINGARPEAPISYSTDPKSSFYQMAKQVYDVSLTLTADQKAMAMFWRDVPGATTPGHWLSILQQVVHSKKPGLDKAAIAYALTGVAINDAVISCWKTKYHYNLLRPITYIRAVMGQTSWNSFLGTPAHPEYSSGHSVLSSAAATALQEVFGNVYITDHTHDYLGFAPRSYSSFTAMAEEAAQSRVYGGIHFQQTVDLGLIEGKKVANNILSRKNHKPSGKGLESFY